MTTVGLVTGADAVRSTAAAIRGALEDADATATAVDPAAISTTDIAITIDEVGSEIFETAAETAREVGMPLLSIELGGIGGRPVTDVDAAISGYAPGSACHECLRTRIGAVGSDTDDPEVNAPTARLAGAIAGRELATLLSGGQSAIVGGVIELPYTERRVLPVPYCGCGARDRKQEGLRRTHEERPLEESLSAAEVAFDDRLGPITAVGEIESFPVPYYLATLAGTPFSDVDAPDHAAGVDTEWDPAFMKALGEALERYSAAIYRTDGFETNPTAPVDPSEFVAPENESGGVTYWQNAEDLGTGKRVQLPAELVVFPPPERTIRPAITTGLGLGNDGTGAILSGLYEVIERDAAMLTWYSTDSPAELVVNDESFRTLAARVRSEGLEVTVLLLTRDIDVPVVAACVHRNSEWPRFAAGSAADFDPAAASRNALAEAIQNWLELRRLGPDRAAEEGGAIGTHAEFPEETRKFVDSETTIPADAVGPSDTPEGEEELEALVGTVEEAGIDAYAARLTPRDVESLGFEAVRVVIPTAQPLFTGDPYFGERARTVSESLGFEPRLDREYHPFP